LVGGTLIALAGWRWIFLVNLPIAALGLVLLLRVADSGRAPGGRSFDLPGQGLAMLALAALTAAVIEAGPLGARDPRVLACAVVAVVAGAGLVLVERRSADPMLPGRLFRSTVVKVALIFGAAINFAYYGLIFVLSLFLQEAVGFDAFHTGLAFIPLTATFLLVNALSGWVAGRHGARWPMISGACVSALGLSLLLRLGPESGIVDMLPPFLLIPAGMGFAIPAMYAAVLSAIDRDLSGIVSAVVNAARQAGGVVGVAAFGALAGGRDTVTGGLHVSALIAALLVAATAGLVAMAVRPGA
jgi:DHA2 family methylenomycin A resistance protein-like MFS transporter